MNKSSVSVIVVVKNMASDLRKCLNSLKKQDFDELIVVDGGSSDDSLNVAREFTKKAFTYKGSLGFARNFGIKKAKGNIIAFIDADCIANPRWIKIIKKEVTKDRPVVGGRILLKSEKSLVSLGSHLFWFSPFMTNKERFVRTVPTCNIAYHKSLFSKRMFKNINTAEDAELNYYLFKKSIKIKYDPRMIVYHKKEKILSSFLRKVEKRGAGFFVSRKRYNLPFKLPKNKLLFYSYLPFFYLLSVLKSIGPSIRVRPLKTFLLTPFFFLSRIYFVKGLLRAFRSN